MCSQLLGFSSRNSKLIYFEKYGGPNKNHAVNRVVLEHYTTVNVDGEEEEQDIVWIDDSETCL